jgi:hypothetical protein
VTQLAKWSGVDDKHGSIPVVLLSLLGVVFWTWDQGDSHRGAGFTYFAGWVAVATSTAGVFGFTRATREAATKTSTTPPGGGASLTAWTLRNSARSVSRRKPTR